MTPIKAVKDYIVTFEALEEHTSMRQHFIKECGWTQTQYNKIKNFEWFTTKVSIWKDGKRLASDYLGCCCYKNHEEFWTQPGYFDDMVRNCAREIGDTNLMEDLNV